MSETNFNEEYLDMSILGGNGEEIPGGPLKSAGFRETPPKEYITHSRKVAGKKITSGPYAGHYEFIITLMGGVEDPDTGKVFNEKFPLTKKISTIPFENSDGVEDTSVAQYLRAFGYKPAGLDFVGVLTALNETQTIPCKVFITRKDKAVKGEDGKWTSKNLKLKDFEAVRPDGTKHYLDEVVIDGVRYAAKAAVGSFSKL